MKFSRATYPAMIVLLATILSACNIGVGGNAVPTQDIGAVQTQAFAGVMTQLAAQQTQTALAVPPATNTPVPTATLSAPPTFASVGESGTTPFAVNTQPSLFTPIPTIAPTLNTNSGLLPTKNGCNDSVTTGEYPNKVTWPYDRLEVSIGEVVEQFFTHRNIGTCQWDEGYQFAPVAAYSSPEISEVNTIYIAKFKVEDIVLPNSSASFKGIIKAPKTAGDYQACWKLKDEAGNQFGEISCLFITVRKP